MVTWIRNRCEISNIIIQGKQKTWCWYELELLLISDRGLVFPLWLNLRSFGSGLISERGKSVCWFIMSRQLRRYIDKCAIRSPSPFPSLWALTALCPVLLRLLRKETTFGTWGVLIQAKTWPRSSRDNPEGLANPGFLCGTQTNCWTPPNLESSALPSQCFWDSACSF